MIGGRPPVDRGQAVVDAKKPAFRIKQRQAYRRRTVEELDFGVLTLRRPFPRAHLAICYRWRAADPAIAG